MRLIEELRAEHDLIEQVVGSLRAFVVARLKGDGDPSDGPRFIRFFRLYAGDFHHAREEDTLFEALVHRANLPERGPIAVLKDDHARMAGVLRQLDEFIALPHFDTKQGADLERLAVEYSRALWHHIDAENSVLFPESEPRLRKQGLAQLPSREMTGDERAAKAEGEALLERYAPLADRDVIRGDGCVCCPAMLEGCRGLEHEWWNEWEWDELEEHLASD
jgi:hemerythrin-like domain-containing protein